MEKYIYDNSNGLWYELQGDYYILSYSAGYQRTPYRYLG